MSNDLNIGHGERLRAALAGLLLLSVLMLPFAPALWWLPLLLAALALALNFDLFRFFRRNGGLWFAVRALAYHQIYYVYSAGAFAWCLFEYHVLGIKDRLHVP